MINIRNRTVQPKDYFWLVYYLLLIVVILSRTNSSAEPSIVLRMAFLVALLFPGFLHPYFTPPALMCFLMLSSLGFSYSYLPSTLSLITLAVFFVYIFTYQSVKEHVSAPWPVIALTIYVTIVDLFNNSQVEQLSFSLLLLLLFCGFVKKNSKPMASVLRLSLIVPSVLLCFLFLLNREQFTFDYGSVGSGMEKAGWMDANYFGSAIGIGALCVFFILLFEKGVNKYWRWLYVSFIVLFFIVLLSVASRGAILSLSICMVLLFRSNIIKPGQKLLLILILFLIIYWLYANHYFDLLMYHIEMDDGSGSGRLDIWRNKVNHFFQDCGLLEWLFGIGFRNSNYLGYSQSFYMCFHNDFLNFLVAYGFIGLILFIALLWIPIRDALRNNNVNTVFIGIIYLFICGLTLQPLCEGYVVYYCFYFYLWYLSQGDDASKLEDTIINL